MKEKGLKPVPGTKPAGQAFVPAAAAEPSGLGFMPAEPEVKKHLEKATSIKKELEELNQAVSGYRRQSIESSGTPVKSTTGV